MCQLGKIPMRLHGTNLCINAPFQPVLHRVPCINERIENAPKHYKTHQNMSLQSNWWIGFVRCQKFRCDCVARTFALIALVQHVLHRVSCSNETIQNAPKYYKTHQYMSQDSNEGDRVCPLWKIPMRLHGTNLFINCTISTIMHWVSSINETLPNAP